MYNEQLEQLIDAALADGVLTEKEKQILFKKAQALGVDLDEFEMVLDARLVKLKKAEEEKAASSAPKSNKLGDVKKCPACGAMVQSYQGVCHECGYAFENIDANNSSQKLFDAIDKVILENTGLVKQEGDFLGMDLDHEKRKRIDNVIMNFPVPTTKSDLFEFITSLQSKTDGSNGAAYEAKLNECIEKARLLFSDDELFRKLTDNAKEKQKKKQKEDRRTGIKIVVGSIAACALVVLLFTIGRGHIAPNKCLNKVQSAIEKGDYKKAKKLIIKFTGGHDNMDGSEYEAGDCHESVVALERALLKEDRYDDAKEVFDIYMDKISGSPNEKYYKEKAVSPLERYKMEKSEEENNF